MSTSLENAFRRAATEGRLDRLSIVRDPAGRGWQVNTPSHIVRDAWAVEMRADVVEALLAALTPVGELTAAEMEE